jgi:hypothetical protein
MNLGPRTPKIMILEESHARVAKYADRRDSVIEPAGHLTATLAAADTKMSTLEIGILKKARPTLRETPRSSDLCARKYICPADKHDEEAEGNANPVVAHVLPSFED